MSALILYFGDPTLAKITKIIRESREDLEADLDQWDEEDKTLARVVPAAIADPLAGDAAPDENGPSARCADRTG